MSRLLETIMIKEGYPQNLDYHQHRMDLSYKALYNGENPFSLANTIACPRKMYKGKLKCRLDYGPYDLKFNYLAYTLYKKRSFKLVHDNEISYELKYADRNFINKLLNKRDKCDDIIIVKNQMISDSSTANLVFKNELGLFTPSSCLLKGTKRHFYLEEGIIYETSIGIEDLNKYTHFTRINALIDLEEDEWITIDKIIG